MNRFLSAFGLMLCAAAPVQAASVLVQTPGLPAPQIELSHPGAAFADTASTNEHGGVGVASASAYEFAGGVSVLASTASRGGTFGAGSVAVASGGSGDTFRVGTRTPGLLPSLDDITFLLDVDIITDGSIEATRGAGSYAAAAYSYRWDVSQRGGPSFSDANGQSLELNYDGTQRGSPGDLHVLLLPHFEVRINDVISTSFFASANSAALAGQNSTSNALADFGHTLRWGGTRLTGARDAAGNAFALPEGFQLSLLSEATNFDYMNAASNPYLAQVPEPATWAMMLLGFGAIGGLLRRRPRLPSPQALGGAGS